AGEKDDVDREAHEEHVHRPGRPKQQPLPALQPAPPEQPAHPRPGRVGNEAPLANDATLGGRERNGPHNSFFASSVKSPATKNAGHRDGFLNVIPWIAASSARRPACPAGSANPRLHRSPHKEGARGGSPASPTGQ